MFYFLLQNPSHFEFVQPTKICSTELFKGVSKPHIVATESSTWNQNTLHSSPVTQVPLSRSTTKKSLLLRDSRKLQTEFKTYLKVGQMSSNSKHIIPFVIEWVPNLLPRAGIGELTIKFEFGHQKNGQVDTYHEGLLSKSSSTVKQK